MSVIFVDSFDGYGNNQLDRYQGGYGGPFAGIASGGRNGTNCLSFFDNGHAYYIPQTPRADFIAGFAFWTNTVTNCNFFNFQAGGQTLFSIQINPMAGFNIGSTFSPNGLYFINSWCHIQIKVQTTYSGGAIHWTAHVRFNNIDIITATGTLTTTFQLIDMMGFQLGSSGIGIHYDDFYIIDMDDSVSPVDWIGDARITAIFPNAVGSETNWTPSTPAVDNYTMVDENPDDEDTTYVKTNVAGTIDIYNYPNISLPAGSVIYGVQHNQVARKDNAGSRSLASVCRASPGASDHFGPDVSVGDTYDMYSKMWGNNPDTAALWTETEVNAAQFGPKCTV